MISEATYPLSIIPRSTGYGVVGAVAPESTRSIVQGRIVDTVGDDAVASRSHSQPSVTIDITSSRRHAEATHQIVPVQTVRRAQPAGAAEPQRLMTYTRNATLGLTGAIPRGQIIDILA